MANPFFSLDDLGKKEKEDKSKLIREQFLTFHERKIESIKDLVGYLPNENEIIFIWTLNSFNAFTFIPYLIKYQGKIDSLTLSTYSINSRIVDSLIKYIDKGNIDHVTLLISDSLHSRMPAVVDHLESLVLSRKDVISVTYGWNHSKITLVKCSENYYVIEGSGNWSENSRNEQYVFLKSKQIYDFRIGCIRSAIIK